MKKLIYIVSAFVVTLASCTKEMPSCDVERLYIVDSPSAKVQLSDGKTVWNKGDKVSVFHNSVNGEKWTYEGQDKAATGELTHTGPKTLDGSRIVALYPFYDTARLEGNVLTTVLLQTQMAVENSFGNPILVAVSDNDRLTFKFATAFVRVSLNGNGTVKTIKVNGGGSEVLAGKVDIDVSGTEPVLKMTGTATSQSIQMNCNIPVKGVRKDIYVAVPAREYKKGLYVTVTLDDGKAVTVKNTMPRTMKGGQVLTFDFDFVKMEDVKVVFKTDNNKDPNSPLYDFPTPTLSASSGFADTEKVYKFGTPYAFRLWSKQGLAKATAGNGATCSSIILSIYSEKDGVKYGGSGYSWIKFPAISGKKLIGLDLTMVGVNSSQTINISSAVDSEGKGNEDQVSSTKVSASMYLQLKEPKLSTQYYLCTGIQQNTRIVDFTLHYSE